jgi:hypothetical protein
MIKRLQIDTILPKGEVISTTDKFMIANSWTFSRSALAEITAGATSTLRLAAAITIWRKSLM